MASNYPPGRISGAYLGKDPAVKSAFGRVEQAIGRLNSAASPTGVPISFLAKITGVTGGQYAYREAYMTTAGSPAVLTGGRVSGITAVVVAAGGASYVVGDVLTLSGGTSTTAAQVTATAVAAGVVTSVALTRAGLYTIFPANAVATTGGSGAGCTINISTDSAIEQNGYTASLTNQYVTLTVSNDNLTTQGRQTPTYSFSIPGASAGTVTIPQWVVVPVTVAFNSGSDGTSTTACAYKYDVTLASGGSTVLTNVAPLCGRETTFYGKRLKAVRGMAYYNSSGTLVLWSVDEYPDVVACS